ncbi:poly [ADP-ribose] polymerase tankyrase-2-like [Cloeon dipterum]|uniref:poly [ADP-ribose] polymerase tankyrase-2-like n=1 Tax=Cloeon dipterum TaxID=197152 RepID=UPI00321F7846
MDYHNRRVVQHAASQPWVRGFRLDEIDYNNEAYQWIYDKMHNSIAIHNGVKVSKYHIVKIYQVKNSFLWSKYTARRSEVARDFPRGQLVPEIRLFHGTCHADVIVRNGFNVKYSNELSMFGKGIYFSDVSSKCNQYTFEAGGSGACKLHRCVHCTLCKRKMLVCKVTLGRNFRAYTPMNGILRPPQGCHSVVGYPAPNFLKYPEYVIYNNYQAFPSYMIEYKISI